MMTASVPRTAVAPPVLLGLHLAPAVVVFAGALALAPVLAGIGWPAELAVGVAMAVLLAPIELGILLRTAHRATGRWSLAGLSSRQSPRWWAYVLSTPALLAAAAIMLDGWTYHSRGGGPAAVLAITLLVTLLVDGLINPLIEGRCNRAGAAENFLFVLVVQSVAAYFVIKVVGWLDVIVTLLGLLA